MWVRQILLYVETFSPNVMGRYMGPPNPISVTRFGEISILLWQNTPFLLKKQDNGRQGKTDIFGPFIEGFFTNIWRHFDPILANFYYCKSPNIEEIILVF